MSEFLPFIVLTLAGLLVVPTGLFVTWLEQRAAERRAARTPAE